MLAVALMAGALVTAAATPALAADTFPEYDTYFDAGPKAIPLHDTKYVPQGLAKVDESTLAISYYDWTGASNSVVTLFTTSGEHLATLTLDTKSHVGGIAMTSSYFWVAGEGVVRRYPASVLRAKRSARLNQNGPAVDVAGKASYLGAQGETLWVGNFNSTATDWMYQYRVNSNGSLTYLQDRRTPSEVQGVVVTSNRIIWSTSEGRTNPGRLVVWPYSRAYDGSSTIGNFVKAPNMIEGIVLAGGRLRAVFESSADKYNGSAPPAGDGNGAADVIVRSIHHGSIPPLP
jgi:hypothetical protein